MGATNSADAVSVSSSYERHTSSPVDHVFWRPLRIAVAPLPTVGDLRRSLNGWSPREASRSQPLGRWPSAQPCSSARVTQVASDQAASWHLPPPDQQRRRPFGHPFRTCTRRSLRRSPLVGRRHWEHAKEIPHRPPRRDRRPRSIQAGLGPSCSSVPATRESRRRSTTLRWLLPEPTQGRCAS